MPIAVFSTPTGPRRLGRVFDDALVDLSVAAPGMPDTLIGFLQAGEAARAAMTS